MKLSKLATANGIIQTMNRAQRELDLMVDVTQRGAPLSQIAFSDRNFDERVSFLVLEDEGTREPLDQAAYGKLSREISEAVRT
jgi:hypothetical protein